MKTIALPVRLAALALIPFFTARVVAAPGDVDPDFNPGPNDRVLSTALQGDSKIIIAGDFTRVGDADHHSIARVNADGSLDAAFDPNVSGHILSVAVQPDDRIIIGGEFTSVGGQTRHRLARLNPDGSLDAGFNPDIGGGSSPAVYSTALQPDGKIVIGGSFTSVGGAGRNRIARLNPDGTLDEAFNPGASGTVRGVAVQADGKIIVAGQFGSVAGTTRNRLARVSPEGALDDGFDPNMNSHVNGVALQTDGKIIVGGEFTAVGSETRNYIARLDPAGTLDDKFDPDASAQVRCIAVQVDGKILIGGDFVTLNTTGLKPAARNRIARLSTDGAVDDTFNPNAGSLVYTVSVQTDGNVLIGGSFTAVGQQSRGRIARLFNDAAPQSLTIPTPGRVQWLRGGASPDTLRVSFDVFAEGSAAWSPLGRGARIVGGWELTGLTLPAAGKVRARAFTTGGQYNGSAGFAEAVTEFVFNPEIAVEQPAGTSLTSGTSTVAFGSTLTGASVVRTFTIRNTGAHDLTGLAITIDGDNAPDFEVIEAPVAPVPAGGSTTFTVRFNSAIAGSKEAVLHIPSNDRDEASFDVNLTARVLVPEADDDGDGMTNSAELLLAACGFDPLTDSAAQIAQLRASGLYLASDIHTLALTTPVLERNPTTGHFLLSVGVEKSADLIEWLLLPDTAEFDIPPEGPGPLFYRVLGKKP